MKNKLFDCHIHLIPEINHGPRDLKTSVEMVKAARARGVTNFIATPHISNSSINNSSINWIKERVHELRTLLELEGIDHNILLGMEYKLSRELINSLKESNLIGIQNSNIILLELPVPFPHKELLEDFIFQAGIKGYRIIIAHPERHRIFTDISFINLLKNRDCIFQLNLGSLIGYYGVAVKKLAILLVRKGIYHIVGSDSHNLRDIEKIYDKAIFCLAKQIGEEEMHNLCWNNAIKLFWGLT